MKLTCNFSVLALGLSYYFCHPTFLFKQQFPHLPMADMENQFVPLGITVNP